MNKVSLTGRTTKDIETKYTTGNKPLAVAKFTLAVNRRKKDEADFISCTAFGKTAEVMEKYVKKGNRIGVVGHIQTGSYEKDGRRIYTSDVIVDEMEFLESKNKSDSDDDIPSGFEAVDDDMPF